MIICAVMVPLSVFFHYAYSCRPYIISSYVDSDTNTLRKSYQGGCLGAKAWFRALNPAETLRAIVFAFTMVSEDHRRAHANVRRPIEYDLLEYQDRRQRY